MNNKYQIKLTSTRKKGKFDAPEINIKTPPPKTDVDEHLTSPNLTQKTKVSATKIVYPPLESSKLITDGMFKYRSPILPIPSDHKVTQVSHRLFNAPTNHEELESLIGRLQVRLQNSDADDDTGDLSNVIESLQNSYKSAYTNGEYGSVGKRDGEEVTQVLQSKSGSTVRISQPKFDIDSSEELEINDDARLDLLLSVMNLGNVTRIPLPHSGLVIELNPIPEGEMLDFNIAFLRAQTELGYKTTGTVFTADDVMIQELIMNLIVKHIKDTNLKKWKPETILNLIATPDIPILQNGALSVIYPDGYPLSYNCTTDSSSCNYNFSAKLDQTKEDYMPDSLLSFLRTMLTDRTVLDDWMIEHLSVVGQAHSEADILKYQTELSENLDARYGEEVVMIHKLTSASSAVKQMEIRFKSSSYTNFHNFSVGHINAIVAAGDTAMGTSDTRRDSREDILRAVNVTNDVKKHACWISSIRVILANGGTTVTTKPKVIGKLLSMVSRDADFETKLNEKVQEFKESRTFSFIGYPNFVCPNCKKGQVAEDSLTPNIIPLNVTSFFERTMEWRAMTRQGL